MKNLDRQVLMLLISGSLLPLSSYAFNPFSVLAGTQAAGIMGGVDQAAEVGVALGDLLTDLELDPTAGEEAEKLSRQWSHYKSKYRESKYLGLEVKDSLDFESFKAKSAVQKIRHLQSMQRTLAKIAGLFGVAPRAAEKAAQIQQTQVNYLILDELMALRRTQSQSYLEDKGQKLERQFLLSKILEEEQAARSRQGAWK